MARNFRTWGETTNLGDKEARVVLMVSRNKDNKHIEGFKDRRKALFTTRTMEELNDTFKDFCLKGVDLERCRLYMSNNTRDMVKVKKELIKHLIDNDDFNLCSIDSKIAAIAATKECAKEKRWFFDFDINSEELLTEFCKDIHMIDKDLKLTITKTPNGYAVGTNRGFDTRVLMDKWEKEEVTLKKDDMLLMCTATKLNDLSWSFRKCQSYDISYDDVMAELEYDER